MYTRNLLVWFGCVAIGCFADGLTAQVDCVYYKFVPQTTYRTQPATMSAMVNETVMKPRTITTYKPVWTTETRQRKSISFKPVVKTSEREERYLVRRPVIETSYRERQVEETSYETVTEMREQRYLVESPATETQLREEKIVVRKPVTSTMMTTENVTTYKPVTETQTEILSVPTIQNELVVGGDRNRLRWLRPAYYVDPLTGLSVFRGRGLHWTRESTLQVRPTIQSTLIPQQVQRTTYLPETVQVQKPIEITQFVDQIETRKVPVQVQTTSKKIHVVKIPVTVSKPVTKIRTERIPIQETKYREEVYVRKVPVTETTYQKVETLEPYSVQTCRWVAETKEVNEPTVVARRVNYSVDQIVPETTWMRIPVDAFGNAIGPAEVVGKTTSLIPSYPDQTRLSKIPVADPAAFHSVERNGLVENNNSSETGITAQKPTGQTPPGDATSNKPDSVLVPETQTSNNQPLTDMIVIQRPANPEETNAADSVSGLDIKEAEEPVIDRPPSLSIDTSDRSELNQRPQNEAVNDTNLNLNSSN